MTMKVLHVLVSLFVLSCAAGPIVKIAQGDVEGIRYSDVGSLGFLGIPFAESVSGANRWTNPVMKKPWSGTFKATAFAPGCPQKCNLPPHTCPVVQSEDCLTLNIFTPAAACTSKLPVMVYLPGGRFEQGASGTLLYDGRFVVNKTNTVIVTTNYRLGALGFLYIPEQQGARGNFGVRDQRLALRFVQENIGAFCGDPKRVTLFGQSAGASSTTYHMLSSESKGLFSQVIVESNPAALPWKNTKHGRDLTKRFAKALDCKEGARQLACMKAAPVADVVDAQITAQRHFSIFDPLTSFLPWTPIVSSDSDAPSDALPLQPLDMYVKGQFPLDIPLMFGSVGNESNIFIYEGFGNSDHISLEVYLGFIEDVFGLVKGIKVLEKYPAHSEPTIYDTMTKLGTHFIFLCPTRFIAKQLSAHSKAGTFLYWFNHVISFAHSVWGPAYPECYNVTCHGSELPFLWDIAKLDTPPLHPTAAEVKLSEALYEHWTSFAHTGKPAADWASFTAQNDAYYRFETPDSGPGIAPDTSYCDFWDEFGYGQAEAFLSKLELLKKKRTLYQ